MPGAADAPTWSDAELERSSLEAIERFRSERLSEPLELYLQRVALTGDRVIVERLAGLRD